MATAYEPEEESPTLAAPEEDCEESEGVDDTADLEKRTEINLKDIEENNGLLRGLNKLTREKKLEQVCNYVKWDDSVDIKIYKENRRRFYHRKLDLSYDVTNSDMCEREVGDLIFYYLTKEVEPDEHACEIIGRLEPFRFMHESWISDCSGWLGDKITFAQFYSRVGNKWAALEQFVYKHKALMLNSCSGSFLRNLKDALPYDTFCKMMTDVRDENGQTAMFHIIYIWSIAILSILENFTDHMYKLLLIQDNNGQTALHVNPKIILLLLQFTYRTKLRQKTLNLFNIKDNNNKIAVDLIEDDSLKYELTKFVDQVEQNKYVLILKPKVLIIYTTKGRDGAEEEASTIYDAFELKYTTECDITRKKDKTKEEILKLIEKASRSVLQSALIVIIMSHGSVGAIHDSEGKAVTLTSIEDAMCANERSKDLPKILITQCCQETDDPPSASYIDPSAPSSETDGPTPSEESRTPYVPKNDHFCAIMSCVSGQESTRNVFIPKLAEEIKRSKGQESIEDLARKVSGMMEEEGYEQTPIIQSTLRGTVTLNL